MEVTHPEYRRADSSDGINLEWTRPPVPHWSFVLERSWLSLLINRVKTTQVESTSEERPEFSLETF